MKKALFLLIGMVYTSISEYKNGLIWGSKYMEWPATLENRNYFANLTKENMPEGNYKTYCESCGCDKLNTLACYGCGYDFINEVDLKDHKVNMIIQDTSLDKICGTNLKVKSLQNKQGKLAAFGCIDDSCPDGTYLDSCAFCKCKGKGTKTILHCNHCYDKDYNKQPGVWLRYNGVCKDKNIEYKNGKLTSPNEQKNASVDKLSGKPL